MRNIIATFVLAIVNCTAFIAVTSWLAELGKGRIGPLAIKYVQANGLSSIGDATSYGIKIYQVLDNQWVILGAGVVLGLIATMCIESLVKH